MMQQDDVVFDATPPRPGWEQVRLTGGYSVRFGPLWYKKESATHLLLAFLCADDHLNHFGICHGGAVATFCDLSALSAQYHVGATRVVAPTVTLATDYLHPITRGDWVEARTEIVKETRNMIFTLMTGYVGDEAVFSSRAIFKTTRKPEMLDAPFYRDFANI